MEDILNLTADEIRAKLVEGGMPVEDAKEIKGKATLREKLAEFNASQDTFQATETATGVVVCPKIQEKEEYKETTPQATTLPAYLSLDWHNHVMSQFTDDELFKGKKEGDVMPRIFGLRRLVNTLIGEIVDNSVKVIASPCVDNQYTAVIESHITIRLNEEEDSFGGYKQKRYSDVADCSSHNTSHPYNLHLTSTAASKAESRNLRKILGLRGIISAEEFVNSAPEQQMSNDDFMDPTSITDAQIEALDLTAKAAKINVMKYINKNENERYNSIREVPYSRASDMLNTLMKFRNKVEGFTVVPDELAGYDPNWQLTDNKND